jgi:hypothetical protein
MAWILSKTITYSLRSKKNKDTISMPQEGKMITYILQAGINSDIVSGNQPFLNQSRTSYEKQEAKAQ